MTYSRSLQIEKNKLKIIRTVGEVKDKLKIKKYFQKMFTHTWIFLLMWA